MMVVGVQVGILIGTIIFIILMETGQVDRLMDWMDQPHWWRRY